jgi:hypothetical protein
LGNENCRAISEGVVGVDPPRALDIAAALIRSEVSMSEIETACERRCVWPRGPLTGGGRYSGFSGLPLSNCGPPAVDPPTNSLPLLR